ncbi:MAG: 50S ribosomal protein L19 [Candidatus Omnitrophica bacterium]|nr:50S ribosomal protein L19 [Candidatus Omnitrophota bacterium]
MTNRTQKLEAVGAKQLRNDIPTFDVGDIIKMKIKVKEAEKVRIHLFEGTVIKIQGQGLSKAFTVRKVSFGEGVERTFPIHSPVIEKIDVVSKGLVKRSKLYYLRDRLGKSARVKVNQELTTANLQEAKAAAAAHAVAQV